MGVEVEEMKYVQSAAAGILVMAFSIHPASAQPKIVPLTNADVMRLVAMRLSDPIVIAVINAVPVAQLDLGDSAVFELKDHGVSDAVIAAMRHPSTPLPSVQPTLSLPPTTSQDTAAAERLERATTALQTAQIEANNRLEQARLQQRIDDDSWIVKSVAFGVTETNRVFIRYGWNVTIKNGLDRDQAFDLVVQFLDQSDLVIDTARLYGETIRALDERTINGDKLVSMPGALRVAKVHAVATRKSK